MVLPCGIDIPMWKELENQPEANPSVFSAAPYNFAHRCSQPLCFLNMKKLPCMPLLPSTLQFLKTLGSGCPSGWRYAYMHSDTGLSGLKVAI